MESLKGTIRIQVPGVMENLKCKLLCLLKNTSWHVPGLWYRKEELREVELMLHNGARKESVWVCFGTLA